MSEGLPKPTGDTLRGSAVSGVLWNTAVRVVQQALQFGTTLYVSRLLPPGDFGLVAMATVFTGFAAVLSELGLGSALVREPEIDDRQIDTVFWFSIGMGVGLTALFALIAPNVAHFYREPQLEPITRALGVLFLLNAVAIVPRSLMYRRLQFSRVARVELATVIVNSIVLAGSARAGAHAWSIVYSQLASALVAGAACFVISGLRPGLHFDVGSVRSMMRFGLNFTGFNVLNYWARTLDNLLAGRMVGATALGAYTRAYALMLLPINQIVGVLAQVMFATLSSIQDDKARVKSIFLRTEGVVALLTFPLMAGLTVVADSFVLALMGPRWSAAIPVIRILAPVGAVQALSNPVGVIYTSQGRTDWMLRWGLAAIPPILIAIAVGAWLGSIETIAWAYLLVTVPLAIPGIAIPGKLIGMKVREVMWAVKGPAVASLIMAAIVWALDRALIPHVGVVVRLVLNVAAGAISYGAMVVGAKMEAYTSLLNALRRRSA